MKSTILITLLSFGFAAFAGDRVFTVWRGETLQVRLADDCELGATMPAPITLREGRIRPVRFRNDRYSLKYSCVADRVVWDAKGEGARVLEISVPENAKPGEYRSGRLVVKVIDRVLPPAKDWQFTLDLWQHPWAIARAHGVKAFSPAFYECARKVYRPLVDAGQRFITVTLLDQPWNHQCYDGYGTMVRHIRRSDGSWTFDYSIFDEYVAFCKDMGLGPYISCYTLCPWGLIVKWENERGEVSSAKAEIGSETFKSYWGPFLDDFAAHLKAKGWFDETYISMDERSPEQMKTISEFVAKHAPGLKIAVASNHKPSDFAGIKIDLFCQYICHIDDAFLAEAKARREEGLKTTFYVCCGPNRPNTFLDSEEDEAFWLGYYAAANQLDGFLRWAWNSWGEASTDDVTFDNHSWRQGDTSLVYPNGEPSWRFLKLRQGIVAAEKARILREQGLFIPELDALNPSYDWRKMNGPDQHYRAIADKTLEAVNR